MTFAVYYNLYYCDLCCKKDWGGKLLQVFCCNSQINNYFLKINIIFNRMSVAAYCIFCCRQITSGPPTQKTLPWNDISKYSSVSIVHRC